MSYQYSSTRCCYGRSVNTSVSAQPTSIDARTVINHVIVYWYQIPGTSYQYQVYWLYNKLFAWVYGMTRMLKRWMSYQTFRYIEISSLRHSSISKYRTCFAFHRVSPQCFSCRWYWTEAQSFHVVRIKCRDRTDYLHCTQVISFFVLGVIGIASSSILVRKICCDWSSYPVRSAFNWQLTTL